MYVFVCASVYMCMRERERVCVCACVCVVATTLLGVCTELPWFCLFLFVSCHNHCILRTQWQTSWAIKRVCLFRTVMYINYLTNITWYGTILQSTHSNFLMDCFTSWSFVYTHTHRHLYTCPQHICIYIYYNINNAPSWYYSQRLVFTKCTCSTCFLSSYYY